ncbi:MAG: tRNA pseudouridine(38-40) synthase TruA [Ktedonobacterales bacterium]
MNIAALVAYDGTRYAGFQRQAADKGPTVQGEIEAALERIAGAAIPVEAAGRTDSGVHATGQVVSFAAPRLDAATWQRALNAHLPRDIAIRATRAVPDGFRARWSALARSYRYRILVDAVRSPLRERYVWRLAGPLDVPAMAAAAETLLGEHDFGAFGSSPRDQPKLGIRGHTVRTTLAVYCAISATMPDEVECAFTANGFLSGMVRRLVGTLALVGAGTLSVAAFQSILEARDKTHPGAAAPARGLCLTGVTYPAGLLDWVGSDSQP